MKTELAKPAAPVLAPITLVPATVSFNDVEYQLRRADAHHTHGACWFVESGGSVHAIVLDERKTHGRVRAAALSVRQEIEWEAVRVIAEALGVTAG